MAMPIAAWNIVEKMAAKYPLPQGAPGPAHEEACRDWTRRVCEQLRYSFGLTWGHKSASETRPPSKDTCARQDMAGFVGWDLMTGAGTGSPVLSTYPPPEHDLSGQFFIAVDPIDHLDSDPEPPTPPPSDDLEERVAELESDMIQLNSTVRYLSQKVADLLERMAALEGQVTLLKLSVAEINRRMAGISSAAGGE